MTPDDFEQLVTFIRDRHGLRDELVSTHVDDGRGRCRTCRRVGCGADLFPCLVRIAADAAARAESPPQDRALGSSGQP